MKYKFNLKNTPLDFWQLSMYFTYGSVIGICNIVFTIAMILVSAKVWDGSSDIIRLILIVACALFPIIQPIVIYTRAKNQAKVSKEIEISFDNTGIHVKSDNKVSDLKWKKIKKVSIKRSMIVIFTTSTHGFILTNKVLGKQKKELYNYVAERVNR